MHTQKSERNGWGGKRQGGYGKKRRRIWLFLAAALVFSAGLIALFALTPDLPAVSGGDGNNPPPNDPVSSGREPETEQIESPDTLCVVIDPGHGGVDYPGCVFDGAMEKDLNLQIAFILKDMLLEKGYRVVMTREEDVPISLAARSDTAKAAGADVFISIHHNSLENDSVTEGMETWYNNEANPENITLAEYIQNEASALTQAKNRGLRPSLKLIVLMPLTMPSCLVEVGFLSSDRERATLIEPEYQEKIARGIVTGLETFLSNR